MKLLDLFCGAGGSAVGYHRAGFDEIVGVDIKFQKRYPFQFVQADALEFCASFGAGFDAIHASPPCQGYSVGTNFNHLKYGKFVYPQLIAETRRQLRRTSRMYVIENVVGAKRAMGFRMRLCGTQFGLRVQRHRLFESSQLLMSPHEPCNHRPFDISLRKRRCEFLLTYRDVVTKNGFRVRRPSFCPAGIAAQAMGVEWMNSAEAGESIPPAYTEFIGRQLLEDLRA